MTNFNPKPAEFHQVKIPRGWVSPFILLPIFKTSQRLSPKSGVLISLFIFDVLYVCHFSLHTKMMTYIDGAFLNNMFFRGIFVEDSCGHTYYRVAGAYDPLPKSHFAQRGGSNRGKWHKSATFRYITDHIPNICKANATICTHAILQGFDTFSKYASNALPMRIPVSLTNTGTISGTSTRNLYTSLAVGVFSIETVPKAVFAMDTQPLDYIKRPHPSS